MCGFDIFCHNFNWWIGSYLPPQATGMRGGGEGTGRFLLCHDKIYLTPLRLYSILMIPIICNQFCIVLPLYSLTDDWSPLRSPYPKTPPDLPPLLINCWQVAKFIKVTSRFPLLSPFHRVGQGGVVKYQYTRKKIDKIPQNTPNSSKNTQK